MGGKRRAAAALCTLRVLDSPAFRGLGFKISFCVLVSPRGLDPVEVVGLSRVLYLVLYPSILLDSTRLHVQYKQMKLPCRILR